MRRAGMARDETRWKGAEPLLLLYCWAVLDCAASLSFSLPHSTAAAAAAAVLTAAWLGSLLHPSRSARFLLT